MVRFVSCMKSLAGHTKRIVFINVVCPFAQENQIIWNFLLEKLSLQC